MEGLECELVRDLAIGLLSRLVFNPLDGGSVAFQGSMEEVKLRLLNLIFSGYLFICFCLTD